MAAIVITAIVTAVAVYLFVYGSNKYWHGKAGLYQVDGSSMEPNLHDGEKVIIAYYTAKRQPERYDIVSIRLPGLNCIKRIIGLPGETVQIVNGYVKINGKRLEAAKGWKAETGDTRPGKYGKKPVTLRDGEYFVLGDNRKGSLDSRQFGAVKREYLEGRLVAYAGQFVKSLKEQWED